MVNKSVLEQLPELQQIETIIQHENKEFLSHKILCYVRCDNDLLPVYALTLGNRSAGIPCITFVAGIHGLERIGTQVVLTFLETLLERLDWDLAFSDILQRVRINVLPLINPVGMLNYTRSNGRGIDLNAQRTN